MFAAGQKLEIRTRNGRERVEVVEVGLTTVTVRFADGEKVPIHCQHLVQIRNR